MKFLTLIFNFFLFTHNGILNLFLQNNNTTFSKSIDQPPTFNQAYPSKILLLYLR
jgi:hypothetical protein